MGQESNVHSVHSELLLPELKAGVFLIKVCQGPLQLSGIQERNTRAGTGHVPQPRLAPTRAERSRATQTQEKVAFLTCSAPGGSWLGHPKSSLRSSFPSYPRKVKYKLRKNSACLFFTRSFFGEFQWITWDAEGCQ
jgi:hypothetical protein